MKKIILLSFVLFSLATYAQDTPQLTHYNGGNLSISVFASSNFFGGGSGSGSAGGIISPLMNNYSGAIFSNPAELTFLSSPYFQFDYKLPLAVNNFIDNSAIASSTDDYLQDTTMFILTDENPVYTNVNSSRAGQLGGFNSFSVGLPVSDNFALAFAYNFPFRFRMDMYMNGIETDLHTAQQVGDNEVKFDMLLNTTLSDKTYIDISEIAFGAGYKVFDNDNGYLSLGFTLSHYRAVNYMNLLLKIDGAVVLNDANEYYFNDPSDPLLDKSKNETNNFYWKVKGNFEDSKFGGKFGIFYNFGKDRTSSWNLSLVTDIKPEFTLTDIDAENIGFQPKFMTGRIMGEGDEALDIDLDNLDLSKPHLTDTTKNEFSNEILFQLPSSVTLGVDKSFGGSSISLNLTKYFGKFHYKFAKYEIGKETSFGVKLGANIKLDDELEGWGVVAIPLRLLFFLDVDGLLFQAFRSSTNYRNSYYRITFGAVFGDEIMSDFGKDYNDMIKTAFSLPFPYGISLSRQYTVFNNLTVGVMIFGLPDLALKFSLGYGF